MSDGVDCRTAPATPGLLKIWKCPECKSSGKVKNVKILERQRNLKFLKGQESKVSYMFKNKPAAHAAGADPSR